MTKRIKAIAIKIDELQLQNKKSKNGPFYKTNPWNIDPSSFPSPSMGEGRVRVKTLDYPSPQSSPTRGEEDFYFLYVPYSLAVSIMALKFSNLP
jgi:hypothetical protein